MQHRQIEAFAAVMTSGSASRAAELLGVTQPAISRCIAELERELGFALFDRIRGRMVPAFEGRMFFREVDSHFLAMVKLEAAATAFVNSVRLSSKLRACTRSAAGSSRRPWHCSRRLSRGSM